MDPNIEVKSLLTIKVLRLVKPSLVGPLALSSDPHDLLGDLWEKELSADLTSVPGTWTLSLGNFLRIPQGFGNMYLGETFSSYVVIQNESQVLVTEVTCKIELQTQSQKFLLANKQAIEDLKPGKTIDLIMQHEVKEMGKHMLIVSLSYTVPNSNMIPIEPIVLERYFKFQVKKPLDVKTKLYNSESEEVFLEAQVQNITSTPICVEKVDLEPSPAFNCIPMSVPYKISKSPKLMPIFWPNRMLDVEDSYQYLYRLTPKLEFNRSATNIGKLDIIWKTTLGDRGRLQTSQLQRQPPIINDLKLLIDNIPEASQVDSPFEVVLKILNTTSDRKMELYIELENINDNYVFLGLTQYKLCLLKEGESHLINLSIFPIRSGLINISGIRITDMTKGEKFIFNEIAQVLILEES